MLGKHSIIAALHPKPENFILRESLEALSRAPLIEEKHGSLPAGYGLTGQDVPYPGAGVL